jgi:hypothetical protein
MQPFDWYWMGQMYHADNVDALLESVAGASMG